MTLEQILQALLKLTPEEREEKAVLFNYATNKYEENLDVCVEGEPLFHFTVNQD